MPCILVAHRHRFRQHSGYECGYARRPVETQVDRAEYSGKEVIITVNAVNPDTPFLIGNGCKRCAHGSNSAWDPNDAAGLDFSYAAPSELSP